MKIMQKKMKSMESQLVSAKDASAMGPGKAPRSGPNQPPPKKKSDGCCSLM